MATGDYKYSLIMLVDDSDVDNLINKHTLEMENVVKKVIVYKEAPDALKYLSQADVNTPIPDLVLLDINMPSMNGFQFLDEFKNLNFQGKEKVQIVMLSSYLDPKNVERSKTYPFVKNFISKPLTNMELKSI